MTKPKAAGDKPQQVPMVMLSRDDYTKFKNSVVTGLTELQTTIDHYISGLQAIHGATGDLLKAYINHTNAQLGGHPASASDLPLPDFLNSAAIRAVDHAVADGVAGVKAKRKREKKIRDPNAPRRPSTAYFLFSEHARPTIRKDFAEAGKEIKPAEVNEEALRRWRILPEDEKEGWKAMYRQNWEKYVADMREYNASIGKPVDEIPGAPAGDVDAEADEEEAPAAASAAAAAASDEEEEEEAPTPAPKPAKGAKGKGRAGKGAAAAGTPAAGTPGVKVSAVPLPNASATPSSGRKRKTAADKAAETAAATEKEEPRKKKTRKSKGGAEEDPLQAAAAASGTPAAGEKKKRKKN